MKMDPLDAFREELVGSFRQVLPDPNAAEWLADLVLEKLRWGLAGQRIPALRCTITRDRDARVLVLLQQGVPVPTIAKRLGIDESTVYRADVRERKRRKTAA